MTIQQLIASMHAVSIPHDVHVALTKAHLLAEIDFASQATAVYLAMNPNYIMGTVFPRGKARFKWRAHEMPLWRLDIEEPLWRDTDGVIYQGYEIDVWDGCEFPEYFMRADLESWSVPHLKQVLDAARAPAGS